MMQTLSLEQALTRRLEKNYLLAPAPLTQLAAVVGAVCGVQAQVINAAELAIAARVAGLTHAELRSEIWEKHSLVKTYGPRSTLHLLPASELPLWMAAMQARESLQETPWYQEANLDEAQGSAMVAAIGEALDGRCLTREQLTAEVSRRVGAWAEEWLANTWGAFLAPAAQSGLLCFGPSQGSKVTFVRADQWIGGWQEIDPDAALLEICRRYFQAYAPATPQDFARWFWLKPERVRPIIAQLGAELEEVEVAGRRALSPRGVAPPAGAIASLRLVPQYDCYYLGSGLRESILLEKARQRIFSFGRGKLEGAVGLQILLIDGIISGIWQRKAHGKKVDVMVEPFVELSPDQQDHLQAEAARIGDFLGLTPSLVVGKLE